MPPFLQAAISSGSISREASLMSVSPAQNFSKPPPVPAVPTVTLTPGFAAWNSSAIASVRGPTVLDPSMRMEPDRSPLPAADDSSSLLPHAATPKASTATEATTMSHLELVTLSPSRSFQLPADGPASAPPSQRPPDSLLLGCIEDVKKM